MPLSNSWENDGYFPGYVRTRAVLLADGCSVLVTGGTRNPDANVAGTRDTWLYDGSTLTQLSARMVEPRFGHTATLMGDDRVLITGCEALQSSSSITAEVYDHATRQFIATANLTEPRGWHTATWLPSKGMVLVVGGEDPADRNHGLVRPKTSAELYDPAAGTFRPTKGRLAAGRSRHTATLLPDGRVLILGGRGYAPGQTGPVTLAEIYNPATETFTPAGNLSIGREDHAATLLHDGRVLVAGGYEAGSVGSPKEEVFDPTTNTFSAVGPIGATLYGLSLVTLPNGRAIAFGGTVNRVWANQTIEDEYFIFDPSTQPPGFSIAGSGLDRMAYQTATPLANGAIYAVGGCGVSGTFPKRALIYWPDLGLLRIRFHGAGRGAVRLLPHGDVVDASADLPVAVGLTIALLAEPAPPKLSIGWAVRPGGKLQPKSWGKTFTMTRYAFDGWGRQAPFDPANPLILTMASSQTVDVNFSARVATATRFLGFPRP